MDHLVDAALDPNGLDFGFAVLRRGYAEPLMQNPRVVPIDSRIWLHANKATPEGYFLMGYPHEWISHSECRREPERKRRVVRFGIAAFPLDRIDDKGGEANEGLGDFWGHPECFYAKTIDDAVGSAESTDGFGGVSGGPVFSIERSNGRLVYRLFGIQGSALGRYVRAGAVGPISVILDHLLGADQ
jgi:hypothetical protein